MKRTKPAETKLVICVWHPFTWWRPQPVLAETIRKRWPEMKVLHLPDYDKLPEELPDTDIFVGYSLRAKQLKGAKKLKWIHSTAAGVAQLMYPELRHAGSRRMNPLQLFRAFQLLRSQRITYKNIRVRQFLRQLVIIREMQHLHFR